MKNLLLPLSIIILMTSSCVSKKKYVELETRHTDVTGNFQKLELKFDKIEKRVEIYNKKINSLKGDNVTLESDNVTLKRENALKLDMVEGKAVVSKETRSLMNKILSKIDPKKLATAKTLKDSLDLAVSYSLVTKTLDKSEFNNSEDIDINIEETVVMISISDKLLFNSGSYQVKKSALKLLAKLAVIIQSEPSIDVMIEGHADSKTIKNESVNDNWDLSVKRSTSIVRLLQNKFDIEGSRLIASGRGDTMPLLPNTSNENRAKNRRTKIILLPNLNKFFALLTEEGVIEK
ncbi:cell envelope biogenesis protein OmpA [Polaribacter sp. SA4-10]|uniref:OmpA/MotB family protein n=1 Tax=Polaribacter sp. SA4-10 TaxID=754397 RepID=UPI000B3CDDB3|nr:OmpA family protein [Polaribacter sp. SA4-10]ARV08092.1 cell envelope biogenesis protein OmpA [Polaribacter sp. SA4-10]